LNNKDKKIQQIIFIEGIYNVIVLFFKFIVGLATNSLAIMGDAMHSLTDVLNNVVIWLVIRASRKPPDDNHPYGHRKFETMAVFGLASLLVVLAVELILNALRSDTESINTEPWGLAVMLVVLLLNTAITLWERIWAKKLNSDILYADAQHTFVDVLTTILVIVSWQLSAMGYFWLDKLCAIGVAMLVLYFAFGLFQKAVPILVDGFAIDPKELTDVVSKVTGVKDVKQVRSRWIGSKKVVDLVITVDAKLLTKDSHKIADAVEEEIRQTFNVTDISTHVEPHEIS
jgi:cation diffusion facilitator family transporter